MPIFFNAVIFIIKLPFFVLSRAAKHKRNTIKLTITILAPVGVENAYDATKPMKKQMMEITADAITTERNCLKIRIADNAGKMIKLESA